MGLFGWIYLPADNWSFNYKQSPQRNEVSNFQSVFKQVIDQEIDFFILAFNVVNWVKITPWKWNVSVNFYFQQNYAFQWPKVKDKFRLTYISWTSAHSISMS